MTRNLHMELLEVLLSSLDIRKMLQEAYPLLLGLVPADYGAFGLSSSGRAEDYEWIVKNVPGSFFTAYPEMAAHDFVRLAVVRQPDRVLPDTEMLSRRQIEANELYHRAHELGMPIEHAMAVMLHVDARWQSGLSLYRERRRPFSEEERRSLQRLTPAIATAVRNWHVYDATATRSNALEGLLDAQGAALVIVAPPSREVARTATATPLLDRWFSPVERRGGGLPAPLIEFLERAVAAQPLGGGPPSTWARRDAGASLEVTFAQLPHIFGPSLWALMLREESDATALPAAWRARLTRREHETAARVLRGWTNQLIAEDLGCAQGTVKKHLKHVFDKLGVESRAALAASAARLRN